MKKNLLLLTLGILAVCQLGYSENTDTKNVDTKVETTQDVDVKQDQVNSNETEKAETEKKTEEILEKYPNISAKYYDCALKEEDEFLSALQINSIFKTVDFLVLKRAETLKSSGIQKLFKLRQV